MPPSQAIQVKFFVQQLDDLLHGSENLDTAILPAGFLPGQDSPTATVHPATVAANVLRTQRLLQAANRKLQVADLPLMLKATAYLRLCCSALQTNTLGASMSSQGCLYRHLLAALSACDPEWWLKCEITETGLASQDPMISILLRPIDLFVKRFQEI